MTNVPEEAVLYITQISMFVDLINLDPEIIDYLVDELNRGKEAVSRGQAFPLMDYSKMDTLKLQNETLSAVINLCETRRRQIEETERIKKKPKLQDEVLRALGIR